MGGGGPPPSTGMDRPTLVSSRGCTCAVQTRIVLIALACLRNYDADAITYDYMHCIEGENYSPHKTADDHHGDCSGTKFYHWGALTGMITLIEEGFY